MSKPALGRGLGDLMGKAATPKSIPDVAPQETESAAGPGVSSLLHGKRANSVAASNEGRAAEKADKPPIVAGTRLPFPLWYLFAADIVLLLFAFLLVFKDPAALDWKRIGMATVATVLGGALAAAGIMLAQKDR